jgi:hypothetical protein
MRLVALWPLLFLGLADGETRANWSANYPPCNQHSELLKQGHMDLGVRLATANPFLAEQFRRALDAWARVLDLDWHEDDTQNCAIQLVDGVPELFHPTLVVARAHLPDRPNFQGWIAFNTMQRLDEAELYRIAVHEIGHMLGLPHSSSANSVMYFLNLEGLERLDPADLAELAKHHKLRIETLDKGVAIGAGR